MADWKRPDSVPVPQIWRRFEGKRPVGKNGKIPKFRIQDMTDDMREMVIDHMCTIFLRDEPTCQNKNLKDDPVTVKEFRHLWNEVAESKLTLVCLVENKEELGDDTLPDFAGCNMTHWTHPNVKHGNLTNPSAQKVFDILDECHRIVNCFEHYNVPGYMYAFGLSVDPIYRGQGIGYELLKARFPLGKAVGIKLTATIFTAIESQVIAEKAGFETLSEVQYADFKDENGEVIFKGLKPKSAKLMAARIE